MVEEDKIGGLPGILSSDVRGKGGRSGLLSAPLLRCMRPKQWIKNLFLFAGLMFTLDQGHGLDVWLRVGMGFVIFSFLSAAVYIINDIADAERDRLHPVKRFRPIASGEVEKPF